MEILLLRTTARNSLRVKATLSAALSIVSNHTSLRGFRLHNANLAGLSAK